MSQRLLDDSQIPLPRVRNQEVEGSAGTQTHKVSDGGGEGVDGETCRRRGKLLAAGALTQTLRRGRKSSSADGPAIFGALPLELEPLAQDFRNSEIASLWWTICHSF